MKKPQLLSLQGLAFIALLAIPLLLVISAYAQGAQAAQGANESGMCRREVAIGVPSWVTTGTWRNDNLVVVNVAERRLAQIASDTGVASELGVALGDYLLPFNPTRIREGQPAIGGFMVEVAGGKLLGVDRNLTPRRQMGISTAGLGRKGGDQIAMLHDWIWAGDQVIGYADIQGAGTGRNSWKNGFVRFDPARPQSLQLTRERSFPDTVRASMTLTYPLLASIGSTGYVALVDGQMALWRFGPGDGELRPIQAFPEQFQGKLAPMLPNWLQREEYPDVMEAVERETMPAGLWAWDKSLFLLIRSFESGERRWYLSKIDPGPDDKGTDKSRVLWTARVPSSANHLTVFPGPDKWAFLEKGPVAGWMSQETHHILYVKAVHLRKATMPQDLCR